jgi:uncharacterized Fe-S cluster-containing protein
MSDTHQRKDIPMTAHVSTLPGLDCGSCGSRTCEEFAARTAERSDLLERCPHIDAAASRAAFHGTSLAPARTAAPATPAARDPWLDSLGREFDFILEHFPEDPGPREVILPHNPLLTRELALAVGDTLIGRPLGLSCGCPVTHCGVATAVDPRTGVVVWCVTGPLGPRSGAFKDIGYYSAQAYEGLVTECRRELRIGERFFFKPRMCMLQWRHSGLVNYLNRTPGGLQVRLEGLWIG